MPENSADSGERYYYNVATGEVERGYESDWTHRMGPYDTAAEAADALEIAKARNAAWEAEEAREKKWAEGDDDDTDQGALNT